jgi:hypothetical protein
MDAAVVEVAGTWPDRSRVASFRRTSGAAPPAGADEGG